MASGVGGILVAVALAGFYGGFAAIQLDRENSRATQILLEKTELLRLYNWNQITGGDTNVYVPTNFTAPFYPNSSNGVFTYTGTVSIAGCAIGTSYSNDMRTVTITLMWKSRTLIRARSMSTLVSRYGLQNYIY